MVLVDQRTTSLEREVACSYSISLILLSKSVIEVVEITVRSSKLQMNHRSILRGYLLVLS